MSPKYVIGEAPPGHGGREEGTLNIYAPDGHLWDGGLKDMWDCTEMPMPNGRIKYMQLDQSVLRNANYPRNKVDRVNLIVRRPHNIPTSIERFGGMGITGRDFIVDRLGLEEYEGGEKFEKALREKGYIPLLNLRFKPVIVGTAFPRSYNIRRIEEARERINGDNPDAALMATEFPQIGRHVAEDGMGYRDGEYRIEPIDGSAEGWPASGQAHSTTDVIESGDSLRANELYLAEPFGMEDVTSWLIIDEYSYFMHKEFVDEFVYRSERGRDDLHRRNPELFRSRLNTDRLFAKSA